MTISTKTSTFSDLTAQRQRSRQPVVPSGNGPFAGKVAIVTGSESGIGREMARALGAAGAAVVLNGLSSERLEQTYHDLRKEGYAVASCRADVTAYEDCERLVDTAIDQFGRLDILITNASISMRAYFADMSPDVFRRVMDSNVYGSVYPVKAALPYLLATKGSVTFISSISAINGIPTGSAYCAGKAAMANLAHTLRLETHGSGMHFGVVHVGFTRNDAEKRVLDADGRPVPIAHRPPHMQKSQAEVAAIILRHIQRRRRRTTISGLGKLMLYVTRFWPRLGEWVVLRTMQSRRSMYG